MTEPPTALLAARRAKPTGGAGYRQRLLQAGGSWQLGQAAGCWQGELLDAWQMHRERTETVTLRPALSDNTYTRTAGKEEGAPNNEPPETPRGRAHGGALLSHTLSWQYLSVRSARMRSIEYMSSGSSVSASSVPKHCNIWAISFTVRAKLSMAWWDTVIAISSGSTMFLQLIKSA